MFVRWRLRDPEVPFLGSKYKSHIWPSEIHYVQSPMEIDRVRPTGSRHAGIQQIDYHLLLLAVPMEFNFVRVS